MSVEEHFSTFLSDIQVDVEEKFFQIITTKKWSLHNKGKLFIQTGTVL
jgi:hypothetical protein